MCRTQSTLIHVVDDWQKTCDKDKQVGLKVNNLIKTSDVIPHWLFFANLKYMDVRKMTNMTPQRTIFTNGLPQGSIMGPIIYNIVLNNMCLMLVICDDGYCICVRQYTVWYTLYFWWAKMIHIVFALKAVDPKCPR